MSQFQDAQSDPKKQFLNALIHMDTESTKQVYQSQPGARLPAALTIHMVAGQIQHIVPETDKQTLQKIMQKIIQWKNEQTVITTDMIINERLTLTEIVSKNFYAALNLGLVPAGTTAGQTEIPTNKPADPNRTAKI